MKTVKKLSTEETALREKVIIREILRIASEAYYEPWLIPIKGEHPGGEGLAEFITREIRETCEGLPDPKTALDVVCRAVGRARGDVNGVLEALEDVDADDFENRVMTKVRRVLSLSNRKVENLPLFRGKSKNGKKRKSRRGGGSSR